MSGFVDKDINTPLRMYIAIQILRAWNNGTVGYHAEVVSTVNDWIDSGMVGPIPFPRSPFFADWAEKQGFANVDGAIGLGRVE